MARSVSLENLRTEAFKAILWNAFKVFPTRVEEIFREERWNSFGDFMAAVERRGRLLFNFKVKLLLETIGKGKAEEIIRDAYDNLNTTAMHELLSAAFFGMPEGEADQELSKEALKRFQIETWRDMAAKMGFVALEVYKDLTGRPRLEDAKLPTVLFDRLPIDSSDAVIMELIRAFGLPTKTHLGAMIDAYRSAEITLEDLDRSIGDPEYLTKVVQRSPSNIYKGIEFSAVDPPIEMGYAEAYS